MKALSIIVSMSKLTTALPQNNMLCLKQFENHSDTSNLEKE
jgi:hypothetical protein